MHRLAAISLLGMIAVPVHAQHAAHVHGSGSLKLAIDNDHMMIELTSPAHDIVGFEHAPSNDEQRAAIASARDSLADGVALFGLPAAAACKQESVKIESALLEDDHGHDDAHADKAKHDDEHHDDDHKDGDHADDDDHAHGAKHEDEHDDHGKHDGDDTHSEFRVSYRFDCANPSELSRLSPAYFKLFPRAEVLDVQAITDAGQISVKLTPDDANLTLPDS